MRYQVNSTIVELVQGNIADQEVDAIVNTASSSLTEGHEVFGVVHHRAGPELMEACRRLGHCPEGEARVTAGYRLKARLVIHVATPRTRRYRHPLAWDEEDDRAAILAREALEEPRTLAAAYHSCLSLAVQHGVKTLALPALGTGAYHFPAAEVAPLALQTVAAFLAHDSSLDLLRFVIWNEQVYAAFVAAARGMGAGQAVKSNDP